MGLTKQDLADIGTLVSSIVTEVIATAINDAIEPLVIPRFEALEARVDSLELRMNNLEVQQRETNCHLARIDGRLNDMDGRLMAVESDVKGIISTYLEQSIEGRHGRRSHQQKD